jgi:hypothetical protein
MAGLKFELAIKGQAEPLDNYALFIFVVCVENFGYFVERNFETIIIIII